ncbi:MAG: hypothetical protein QF410_01045 [Planctomycetota bacterium]|nr:hypothetical protein [Planctomycetota bacterium]
MHETQQLGSWWCFAGSDDAGDPERVVEEARFSKSAARGREAVEDGRLRSLAHVFMNNPGSPAGMTAREHARARRPDYIGPMTRRRLGVGPALAGAVLAVAGSTPPQEVGFRIGQLVPDVALPTIDGGGVVRLSDLRGKRVLLIEFASW